MGSSAESPTTVAAVRTGTTSEQATCPTESNFWKGARQSVQGVMATAGTRSVSVPLRLRATPTFLGGDAPHPSDRGGRAVGRCYAGGDDGPSRAVVPASHIEEVGRA